MDAERWRRVESLYHAALQIEPGQRSQFLDHSCSGDAALRAEVESLLAYAAAAEAFIEAPALDVAARLLVRVASEVEVARTGATIAQFHVLRKIGEGGMGVVYEAEDTRLGRQVALKFLPAALAANPQALARLAREARAASALNHPNICTIYSVQDAGDQPFIEMERLDGQTLRERIAGRPLAVEEIVSITLQILDGLEAAHAKGIVHRDLTPGNIFCTARGIVKILDFGVAQLDSTGDADGAVMGTAAYMSPEQVSGQAVDARSDLFSLGAVIYEMATGGAAFQGSAAGAIRDAILTTEPPPPRALNRRLPAALDRIVLKALRKDRASRYQHAAELRVDFQKLQRRGARKRQYAFAAATLAALLVAGAIGFWYSPLNSRDLFSTNLRLQQVTHQASEIGVVSGALSPDGKYVTYSDARGVHIQVLA